MFVGAIWQCPYLRTKYMIINIYAAWLSFLIGCIAGAISGLFFFNKDWLGGYSSWQRRMIRLGHISCFGIGFLNLLFALTVKYLEINSGITLSSFLLLTGLITMPAVCYLSAWKSFLRNLFFIPALSVIISIILFLWRII